jgi:hypothetical protein
MKQSLLVTTAVAILTGTGALAQAPSDRTQASNERSTVPSAAQSQSKQNPPAALAPVPPSSAGSTSTTQNAPSAPANIRQETTTGQSAQIPNVNSDAQRPQAKSGQPSPSSDQTTMRRRPPHKPNPHSRRLPPRRRRPIRRAQQIIKTSGRQQRKSQQQCRAGKPARNQPG